MSKQIRISDDVWELVEDYAELNRRTVNNAFDFLLEKLVQNLKKNPEIIQIQSNATAPNPIKNFDPQTLPRTTIGFRESKLDGNDRITKESTLGLPPTDKELRETPYYPRTDKPEELTYEPLD